VVTGVSAYSGGLWLGALRAGEETARILGDTQTAAEYHQLFLKGQKTYISKLWNGEYFRYDTQSESKDAIQADQLAGQWYANLTGLGDLVPYEMQISAMKKIFEVNVMKFGNGEMGAANGMSPDGSIPGMTRPKRYGQDDPGVCRAAAQRWDDRPGLQDSLGPLPRNL